MTYPPTPETITAADRTLIERVEGVGDPFKRRTLLSTLSPQECARLVELGYASVDALKWPGPPEELPEGEEPWPLDHRDTVIAAETARAEQEAATAALVRLGDTPPGMAIVLAGTDDPQAAVDTLGLEPMSTPEDEAGESIPLTIHERPDVAHVDGWLFVTGKTDAEIVAALAATRPA